MKRFVYPFIAIIICLFCSAQVLAQYNWQHFGPEGLGEKTRTILFDANGDLLAGSSGGGLWKSVNEGLSWFKVQSYTGNPTITYMVRSGSTIYVATGETSFIPYALLGRSDFDPSSPDGAIGYMGLPGSGIYVSTDNGSTWSNDNALTDPANFPTLDNDGPFLGIQKLEIADNGRLLIGSREGIYYSGNSLNTVEKSTGPASFESSIIYDIETSGNTVLAATKDSLYISQDNGASFVTVMDPNLFVRNAFSDGRVQIEVAPSNPDVIYVASSRRSSGTQLNGVWRSADRGQTWEVFAPRGGPGFSPLGSSSLDAFVLKVFPEDEDGVVIAGQNWFVYDKTKGWDQSAQSFNPNSLARNYLPSPIYTVAFHPENPKILYVGTGGKIFRSDDRGETFYQRTKGYGATLTYSVGSIGLQGQESIIAGTRSHGSILNNNFWKQPYDATTNPTGPPSLKGFGTVNRANNGQVAASYLFQGSVIVEGTDNGVTRSDGSFASTFERFYGLPLNADTSGVRPLMGIETNLSWIVDRSSVDNEGGGMNDNGKLSPQTQFVLDEYIPDGVVAPPSVTNPADLRQYPGKDSLQNIPHYLFLASSEFIWIGNYALGQKDGLLPRWDRLTNKILGNAGDEYFTALTVSGDENHIIYVGTSKGRLFRIQGATDFSTFDASLTQNVAELTQNAMPPFAVMAGRWISDIDVNPKNPDQLAITFAGYGGVTPLSYTWVVDNATTSPQFFYMSNAPKEPTYTCSWVEYQKSPNSSETDVALFIGTETSLFSTRDVNPATPNPILSNMFTDELPATYGNIPVYDIFVRKYEGVITDEETGDYVLRNDNTLFIATHGYGIWSTKDAKFTFRQGDETPTGPSFSDVNAVVFPNPTNGSATLRMELPYDAQVQATAFTLTGQRIGTLVQAQGQAGLQKFDFETESLNPGVYLLKVEYTSEDKPESQTIKLVVTK